MIRVSLGIRGGGVKSAASIGVLSALEEKGIKISEITGDSMGAVIAALYATGNNVERIMELFMEYSTIFSNATRLREGTGSEIIEKRINLDCKNKKMGDTDIPLTISANVGGLLCPKPYYFTSETTPCVPLGVACRASSSFPFLYEHYKYGKQKFWDGGMVANPPIPQKSEDTIFILSSFAIKKKRKLYRKGMKEAEREADIILRPNLLEMKTLGNPEDVKLAAKLGYEAMSKVDFK